MQGLSRRAAMSAQNEHFAGPIAIHQSQWRDSGLHLYRQSTCSQPNLAHASLNRRMADPELQQAPKGDEATHAAL